MFRSYHVTVPPFLRIFLTGTAWRLILLQGVDIQKKLPQILFSLTNISLAQAFQPLHTYYLPVTYGILPRCLGMSPAAPYKSLSAVAWNRQV